MAKLTPVLRAHDPESGDHMLTINNDEYKQATLPGRAYDGEGPVFAIMDEKTDDTVPVYRLVSPSGDHMCTTNPEEVKTAVAGGYREDFDGKPMGFVWAGPGPGRVAVFRGVNAESGDHMTTTSESELTDNGYHVEGRSFYAVPMDVKWTFEYHSIAYGQTTRKPTEQKTAGQMKVISGNASGQATLSMNGSESSTYAWGLTEELTFGMTNTLSLMVGGEAGFEVPFLAEAKATASITATQSFSVGLSAGSHQDWEVTTVQGFNVDAVVDVAAGESKEASIQVDWYNDLSLPFVMEIYVSCTVNEQVLSGADIVALLKTLQPDLKVKQELNQLALMEMTGQFKGSFGIGATVMFSTPGTGHMEEAGVPVSTSFSHTSGSVPGA